MPTVAQITRGKAIRQFITKSISEGKTDTDEIMKKISERWPDLTKATYYKFKSETNALVARLAGRRDGGTLVQEQSLDAPPEPSVTEIVIPGDLSEEARTVINHLLEIREKLLADLRGKDLESELVRSDLARASRKTALLKKIAYDAIEAL